MRLLKYFTSAQLATAVDFLVTVLLSSVCGLYYVLASAIGAVTGGVVNFVTNYLWVFPGTSGRRLNVALRYALVWGLSLLLNTYGVYFLTEFLVARPFLQSLLGDYASHLYILSKVFVSLLVALCCNYPLQRYFVYRQNKKKSPKDFLLKKTN